MVSGFFTSPHDHERIRSGEASEILIASKFCGWDCWLNRFRRSFIYLSPEGANSGGGVWVRLPGPGTGEREPASAKLLLLLVLGPLFRVPVVTVLPAPCRSPASGFP